MYWLRSTILVVKVMPPHEFKRALLGGEMMGSPGIWFIASTNYSELLNLREREGGKFMNIAKFDRSWY